MQLNEGIGQLIIVFEEVGQQTLRIQKEKESSRLLTKT
jgi:hypothetical protein